MKKLLIVFVVVLLSSVLVGCDEIDDPAPTPEVETPVEIPQEEDEETSDTSGNITVENNVEFAQMFNENSGMASLDQKFVEANIGRIIEFDGSIDHVAQYKDYDTRFNILLSYGDYNPDTQVGPTFRFENIGPYQIGKGVDMESNVKIIAKISSYNEDTSIVLLTPESVELR